jgi:DNA-binding NtrC family response regulator
MIHFTIFVVDDEKVIRTGIKTTLGAHYNISTFETAEAAIDALAKNVPDLVLLDIGLPKIDGINALKIIKKLHPELLVIMITAYESVDTVISAMKLGAFDYIIKPIHLESLEATVGNALETIRLRKEVQTLQEKYLQENLPCFISESKAIHEVMQFIGKVARSPDTPVMLLGETGTGKELIAEAIHYRSPNFKGLMVHVNCASMPKDLIESELFGYEKGAFSGAGASGKPGLIEIAANGTLFLDEVGDLSQEAQAKLLLFLESGEFYKVGSTVMQKVKTRVISATNKDIHGMLNDGSFRKDLYFRLGVVRVRIPALNERREDILPLTYYFLDMFNRKFNTSITGIDAEAEKWLMNHCWPGNVRELRNMIERGVLVAKQAILTLHDLGIEDIRLYSNPPGPGVGSIIPSGGVDFTSILESVRRSYIEEALNLAGGNEAQAARLLRINHHTFRYHRKKLQQTNPDLIQALMGKQR